MAEGKVKSLKASIANGSHEMTEQDLQCLLKIATAALAP